MSLISWRRCWPLLWIWPRKRLRVAWSIRPAVASLSSSDSGLGGNVVSLYGKGEVNLDGTALELDMYPSWGRAEQMLPPAVRSIPSAISKQLVRIEMRGKVGGNEGDLKFTKRPVPGLVDPFIEMRNRVVGK